ncbi:hypothetical protein D9758_007565 [Tetrapyrgos nigripes]|uniref:Transmembrane protein n=1 Tax=Tetrapyrgos nigripes TaxID=182062 RepID=A0A8H5LJV4_9AGAR|nr:hypothetical protein D9758_007565 [Tetrapyrgos nigripes]
MSASSSDSPLNEIPPALQGVIELALSAFVKQNLNEIYLIIAASLWLGVSFSLFMALLYSSNAESRRTPLFWFSVLAVGFGTIPSVLFMKLLASTRMILRIVKTLTTERDTKQVTSFAKALEITAEFIKPYLFALTFFSYFSSICVDSILLLRIMAVFPPSRMSRKQVATVFGPLLTLKVARITTVIVLVVHYIRHSKNVALSDTTELYTNVTQLPEPKIAWSLQLIDNGICSFSFLYQLHKIQSFPLWLNKDTSLLRRLRTLFLIAISNFVFPVIFVIIQLILMTRALSYLAVGCLNISGVNIEVIGVLFATIWSAQLRETGGGVAIYAGGEISHETMTHDIQFRSTTIRSTRTDLESGLHQQTSTLGTIATDLGSSDVGTPATKEQIDSSSELYGKESAVVVVNTM